MTDSGTATLVSRLCDVAPDRPQNAYLLCGGAGATRSAARRLSASLMGSTGPSGMTAAAADAVARGSHIDLSEITPEGAGGYLIGQVRDEIVPSAMRSPSEARRRVIVLYEAERLGTVVASALLKTIEEPAPATSFVLCTLDAKAVLDTIVSRCLVCQVPPLPPAEAGADLARDLGCDAAKATHLVEATGSVDVARIVLSDPDWARRRRFWLDVPVRLATQGTMSLMSEIVSDLEAARAAVDIEQGRQRDELDDYLGGPLRGVKAHARMRKRVLADLEERHKRQARRRALADQKLFLATLTSWLRDVLAAQVGARALNAEVAEVTCSVAKRTSPSAVLGAMRRVSEAAVALSMNANAELVIEDALLEIASVVA